MSDTHTSAGSYRGGISGFLGQIRRGDGVVAGTYGSGTTSAVLTVDANGDIVSATSTPITAPPSGAVQYVTVNITAAEFTSLNSTPKVLLPPPPAGQYYFFDSCALEFTFGSTQPDTGGWPLQIRNTNFVTPALAVNVSGANGATQNAVSQFNRAANQDQLGPQIFDGWSLEVANSDPLGPADGSFRVKLGYRLITFG